jgi:hypothetical protein
MTDKEQTETAEEIAEETNSELKQFMINYTGHQHNPEDEMITVHMIIHTLAADFPELVYTIAEENFIRGYQLGLDDATVLEGKTSDNAATAE